MTLEADGFTGSIVAVEGIKDAMVVLNGPTGCKFYHSHLSDTQYPRTASFDPLNFKEEFYFGQPRVPCTYLEGNDYVAGSTSKLENILPSIADRGNDIIVVINSPGASLIGDDLKRFLVDAQLEKRCIAIENSGYSSPFTEGFQHMVIEILTWLDMNKKETVFSKVNLIGISLYQRNWDSDIEELKRLLSMLNVDVGTVICAGTSKEELINSTDAALNIVVYPEFGLEIARWYERKFNIPFILSEQGAPVGHIATMKWLEIVAEALNLDSKEALDRCRQRMKSVVTKIARFHSLTGLPKGATFSIKADSSVALPLTYWLYHYLGMAPVNVETLSAGHDLYERKLEGMLESLGFKDSWNGSVDGDIVDVILADGHTVNTMVAKKRCKAGIEICMPSSEYIDFLPRTITGLHGTLFLLEEILNGLRKNL